MAKKDKKLCWECQSLCRPIDYIISPAHEEVKKGLCRECYERREARKRHQTHRSYGRRTPEMKENTDETKHGPWHG